MKFTENQRRNYLLAITLLIVAIVLACTWMIWHRPAEQARGSTVTPAPVQTAAAEPSVTPSGQDEAASAGVGSPTQAQKISTIVYYQDNDGYLVPVMCSVPMEDGIAKATLNLMVRNPGNDMQAARLGLRTILPENTTIDLDIANGLARIDLSKEVLGLADAAAEVNMIDAIVSTLTEFDTVKEVEFLIGGQKLEKLPHGTDISGRFTRRDINLEAAEGVMSVADAQPVTLYFPSESGTVVVPVTRMVYSRPDVNTAVLELAKGPGATSSLESVLPAGCGLIDVTVENGVARLNFTKELVDLALNSDGGRMALKALVLTCTQFEGIESVEVYIEGEKYDPGEGALSVPTFANVADTIVYNYIQTQSALLVDPLD